jgi:hypothetical protein
MLGMSGEQIVAVGAAVTIFTQLLKWGGIPDRRGPLVVMALSLVGVILWAVSNEPAFTRSLIWPYFAAWVSVAAGAAGVFGFTRALPEAITAKREPPTGAGASPTAKMD